MYERKISLENLEGSSDKLAEEGKTPMYIAIDNKMAGIIAVADTVKDSSKRAIEKLHEMGIQVAMITGDNKRTAGAIAKQVGIDIVLAEVLPEDKANEVKKLQGQGQKVAMVGDGDNAVLAFDEVFENDFVCDRFDTRAAFVAVAAFDLEKLIAQDIVHLVVIGENFREFLDFGVQGVQFFEQLVDFQAG